VFPWPLVEVIGASSTEADEVLAKDNGEEEDARGIVPRLLPGHAEGVRRGEAEVAGQGVGADLGADDAAAGEGLSSSSVHPS
jgi:hypothetical protein